MNNNILKRVTVLLLIRIIMVVSFQLLLALVLSREKAMPWWPFSLIATEALCFVILILLLKKENKPFRSIQLLPFVCQGDGCFDNKT